VSASPSRTIRSIPAQSDQDKRPVSARSAASAPVIGALDGVLLALFLGFAAPLLLGASLADTTLAQAFALLSLGATPIFAARLAARFRPQGPLVDVLGASLGVAIACLLAPTAFPLLAALAGAAGLGRVYFAALQRRQPNERVVVIGATESAKRFIFAARNEGRTRVLAVFDDRAGRIPAEVEGAPVAGDLDALLAWPDLHKVDRIVIAVRPAAEARVRALIGKLRIVPNRISVLLDFELSPEPTRLETVAGQPVALVAGAPASPAHSLAKRVADLVLGATLAIVFAPFMALIALAIFTEGQGPVFYRQRRQGLNDKPFEILKFRTMRPAPVLQDGPIVQVRKNDPRVTRLGSFLRRTSLDELPQLWNVLTGDMSLVGPRPHAPNMRTGQVDTRRIVPEYSHRLRVKPGLTGWAQVNGSRGPLERPEEVRERIRLDLEYISRPSIFSDLAILARTAPALLGDRLRSR
jgi:exopolysaccharide biosynthesis polyprenyl glycosylphosphotransferase